MKRKDIEALSKKDIENINLLYATLKTTETKVREIHRQIIDTELQDSIYELLMVEKMIVRKVAEVKDITDRKSELND